MLWRLSTCQACRRSHCTHPYPLLRAAPCPQPCAWRVACGAGCSGCRGGGASSSGRWGRTWGGPGPLCGVPSPPGIPAMCRQLLRDTSPPAGRAHGEAALLGLSCVQPAPRGPPGLSPARRRPAPLGRGPGLSPDRLPPAFSPHPQVYMNAVWHGWAVPMFLFLAILRLSLNYLIARWVAASSCARAGRSPRAVLHAQRGPAEPALSRAGVCWVSAATRPHSQEGGWLEPKPRPPPPVGPASGSVQPRLPSCCFLAEESPHPRG